MIHFGFHDEYYKTSEDNIYLFYAYKMKIIKEP